MHVSFSRLLRPKPNPIKLPTFKYNFIKSIINTDICKQYVKAKQFEAIRIYLFDKYFIFTDIILKMSEKSIGQSKNEL